MRINKIEIKKVLQPAMALDSCVGDGYLQGTDDLKYDYRDYLWHVNYY